MNTPSSRSVAILTFIAGLTLASEGFARSPKHQSKRPTATAPRKAGKAKTAAAPKPLLSQEELNDEELDLLREVMFEGCGMILKGTDLSKITAYAKKLEQAGKGQRALSFLDIVKKLQSDSDTSTKAIRGGESTQTIEECDDLAQKVKRDVIMACYKKASKEEQYRLAGYLSDDMDTMEDGYFENPAPDDLVSAALKGKKRQITAPLIDQYEFDAYFKLSPESIPKGASELEKTRIEIANKEEARWKKAEEVSARANETKARACLGRELDKQYPENTVKAKVRNALGLHFKEKGGRDKR